MTTQKPEPCCKCGATWGGAFVHTDAGRVFCVACFMARGALVPAPQERSRR